MNRERLGREWREEGKVKKDEQIENGGRGLIEREVETKGQISGAVGQVLHTTIFMRVHAHARVPLRVCLVFADLIRTELIRDVASRDSTISFPQETGDFAAERLETETDVSNFFFGLNLVDAVDVPFTQ